MLTSDGIKKLRLHGKRQQRRMTNHTNPVGYWWNEGWIKALDAVLKFNNEDVIKTCKRTDESGLSRT